jgi:NADH dehydrogenase [ubiquinone] 1 alpha subcomplex assembly factor 1
MYATPSLLSKGFWGRSLDEFKRLSNIALKLEGIKGPSGPYELHSFGSPEILLDCKIMSDVDIGGSSTAHLDWVPGQSRSSWSAPASHTPNSSGHARFHGIILETLTCRLELSDWLRATLDGWTGEG